MKKESSVPDGGIVLVMNAGEDAGHQIARDLLRDGYRVAVTSRHATQLIRIIHGHSTKRVMAVAADTSDRRQVEELVRRVESRFGCPIDAVVCATGMNGGETGGRNDILTIVPKRASRKDALDIAS
jgi:NAD(P)-dependent dehydrogenase (short-subunit alcohol dehydrogenase family)